VSKLSKAAPLILFTLQSLKKENNALILLEKSKKAYLILTFFPFRDQFFSTLLIIHGQLLMTVKSKLVPKNQIELRSTTASIPTKCLHVDVQMV